MLFSKINYDKIGIITAIICLIHCTLLPVLFSILAFIEFQVPHSHLLEWAMIAAAFIFGSISLKHGYQKHHHKITPLFLFTTGLIFLVLNQVFHEKYVSLLIPPAAALIIVAHILNLYYRKRR